MNIYDALFLFEGDLKQGRPLAALLQYSFTTVRYGPGSTLLMPADGSSVRRQKSEPVARELPHPVVETLRRDVLRLAEASDKANRDRMMNDVIPFLLNHHAHDWWFDETSKR